MKKQRAIFAAALALCVGTAVGAEAFVASAATEEAQPKYEMSEMLTPVWEGTTSYKESVLVVEEADGTIAPIDLLYPIESILTVESATLKTTYTEGVDYTVENGKLVVRKTGSIPRLSHAEFHPTTGQAGFESRGGGYVCFYEGDWFHSRQIVVTYTHAEGYNGYIPEGKGRLLSKTHENLKEKDMNILVYGDSISVGGNSSGCPLIQAEPYMPIYSHMFAEGIKQMYGVETINIYNPSVGGTDSAWGLSNLNVGVLKKYEDVDLVILAFGMNDVTRSPESYAMNMSRMANGVKNKYKTADVLMIAPMLPNYDAVGFYGNQPNFYEALMEYETEGTVVVNVTNLHKGVLEKKRYADMTGNNVNHANDFLARLYAQALLQTLEISDYGKPDATPDETPDPNPDTTPDTLPEQTSGDSQSTVQSSSSSQAEKGGCSGSVLTVGGSLGCMAAAAFALSKKRNKKA